MAEFCMHEKHGGVCNLTGSYCNLGPCPNEDIEEFVPVRHGRWERTSDGAVLCTACKRKMNSSQYGYAFCSLCGAKMDESTD
jgi:uncharacterized CHY-type Zn-finger protein